MSIGDTLTRVIIVIEHPQIQLAYSIPIYINKARYYCNTHRNYEHLRTYRYRISYIISLSLSMYLYYSLYYR
jgi:hypothetical protein